jgi:hypothetical protein
MACLRPARAGKSFVLVPIAVFLECFRDWRPFLQRGERASILIIACDRRQARVIFRYVRGLLTNIPVCTENLIRVDDVMESPKWLIKSTRTNPLTAPHEAPQCLSWNIHSHRTVIKRSDYYVDVDRIVERKSWYWVIQRRSREMGVHIEDGPFRTKRIALQAGRVALDQFLRLLAAQIQSEIGGWATKLPAPFPFIG